LRKTGNLKFLGLLLNNFRFMKPNYSRRESVEEKRNLRSAILLIVISIVAITVLVIYGIPVVGKISSYVSGLKGGVSSANDKTPPAPPRFDTYPDFTNKTTISLSGNAEPGATVKLTFNGSEQEVLVDKDGNFSLLDLKLKDGDNNFSAFTQDPAGNVSQKTVDAKIVFDNKTPDLTIESPADGTQFFGSEQRQATIKGTTDSGSSVTINDRIVSVDETGKFQYTLTLSGGENKFTVKSVDPAGNSVEKELKLTFSE
jgi:hypothetical protein